MTARIDWIEADSNFLHLRMRVGNPSRPDADMQRHLRCRQPTKPYEKII